MRGDGELEPEERELAEDPEPDEEDRFAPRLSAPEELASRSSESERPSREAAGRSRVREELEEGEPEDEEEPDEPGLDELLEDAPFEDWPDGPLRPRTLAGSPPEDPDDPEPEDFALDEPEPEDFDEPALAPALAPARAPEADEERWAPWLTALEDPDSRSDEVLAGGEAWLAGVCLADADEDAEELLDVPSPPLFEDLEAEPPSETMASAESASPRAASPPSRAVSDLTGNRASSSSDEPSRSIALGSSVVVRASMACLPASGPTR